MSCAETHSSLEWKLCSPAKMFGVGSPMKESFEPSVPPRMDAFGTSRPARLPPRRPIVRPPDADRGSLSYSDRTPQSEHRRGRRESVRRRPAPELPAGSRPIAAWRSRNPESGASPRSVRRQPVAHTGERSLRDRPWFRETADRPGGRWMKSAATLMAFTIFPFA